MKKSYDDIIHLPHHVSTTHPRMAIIDRAAQFSPFAALTGYDAAIKETARLTGERIELDEYRKEALSSKLQVIAERLKEYPEITITYYQADRKKTGGSYITAIGAVKKIDDLEKNICMIDGTVISMNEIIDIEGQIFEKIELYFYEEQ